MCYYLVVVFSCYSSILNWFTLILLRTKIVDLFLRHNAVTRIYHIRGGYFLFSIFFLQVDNTHTVLRSLFCCNAHNRIFLSLFISISTSLDRDTSFHLHPNLTWHFIKWGLFSDLFIHLIPYLYIIRTHFYTLFATIALFLLYN